MRGEDKGGMGLECFEQSRVIGSDSHRHSDRQVHPLQASFEILMTDGSVVARSHIGSIASERTWQYGSMGKRTRRRRAWRLIICAINGASVGGILQKSAVARVVPSLVSIMRSSAIHQHNVAANAVRSSTDGGPKASPLRPYGVFVGPTEPKLTVVASWNGSVRQGG